MSDITFQGYSADELSRIISEHKRVFGYRLTAAEKLAQASKNAENQVILPTKCEFCSGKLLSTDDAEKKQLSLGCDKCHYFVDSFYTKDKIFMQIRRQKLKDRHEIQVKHIRAVMEKFAINYRAAIKKLHDYYFELSARHKAGEIDIMDIDKMHKVFGYE